jgi:hypothetical protein
MKIIGVRGAKRRQEVKNQYGWRYKLETVKHQSQTNTKKLTAPQKMKAGIA